MFRAIVALSVGVSLICGPALAQAAPPGEGAAAGSAAPNQGGAPALSPAEALTYRLAIGDKVHITTFDEPQLTGDFIVGADGLVSLLWIGGVQARDRTAEQVRADIEARLKDGYILNPTVSLQVLVSRPFYILGEVNKPGQYTYTDGLTVMSAVATAGGFTYRANKKKVFIKHVGKGDEGQQPLTATTEIQAGDTIRITERYF